MNRLLPLLLFLAACASTGSNGKPRLEDLPPLERAGRALETGEFDLARTALEEHLDDEPDDPRGRYLLARTLAGMGEPRGARAELTRAVALDGENPLYWSLLARLHEQLGEHSQALGAYGELLKRVPDSREPIRGIARCQLYLGRPEAALAVLHAGNEERPAADLWSDFLSFQALRRLHRPSEAEVAARAFLERAKDEPAHADRVLDVRRWLSNQSDLLEPSVRQAMVDYVRAACRLRLPGATGPEEAVLESAPERLFLFDDRPVFVTLFAPEGGPRFRGRGRGGSLAAALKGAVADLQDASGYAPLLVRQAAVRVEVGRRLQPVEARQDQGRLVLEPAFRRGEQGLALRADGREVYALPGDVLAEDLADVPQVLAFAATSGGLAEDAWYGNTRAVYVFETEAFVSPAPGAAPMRLDAGEPGASPVASPSALERSLREGAGWLTTLLRADGTCAPGYQPRRDAYPEGELDVASEARVATTLARLRRRQGTGVLLAASRHLIERAGERLGAATPESAAQAQAWLLLALDALADQAGGSDEAASPAALAELVSQQGGAGVVPLAALALWRHAATSGEARWQEHAARLWPQAAVLADTSPLARDVQYVAGCELGAWPEAREQVLAWALSRLDPAAPPLSAGELAPLARVARFAARRDHEQAGQLRELARLQAQRLLARQLDERHRWLLPAPARALGGFRADLTHLQLDPQVTVEALEALLACEELLGR
jgi:tetratricopeptide (TPR) repeat protein